MALAILDNNSRFVRRLAVLSVLSLFLLVQTSQRARLRVIAIPNLDDLRSGDIIFRQGVSVESYAVRTLDGQFYYSHVGIIERDAFDVRVIHASYGEHGQLKDGVLIESLAAFLKPESARAAAVMRLNDSDSRLSLSALHEAERFLKNQTPFDDAFDLSTQSRMYCTELIWVAYKHAGLDLVDGHFDNLPLQVGDGRRPYLLPGSLFRSTHLHVVWTSANE